MKPSFARLTGVRVNVDATLRLIDRLLARGIHVIYLSTNQVFDGTKQLLKGWVETLATGHPIRAFQDMMVAPTPIRIVTEAIAALMHGGSPGVYQLTGPRDVSYADVGRCIAQQLRVNCDLVKTVSAKSSGMPIGATPPHTTLDSTALRAAKRHCRAGCLAGAQPCAKRNSDPTF